jgi:two-component system chemotaxis response regulator CheY
MAITSHNHSRSVMIVDDSEVARMLLRDILEAGGYVVVAEAGDGVEAVERYAELRPHITIMDLRMPNKDGIDATKDILAMDRNAKVLMCSSIDAEGLLMAAVEAGASGVVFKPYVADGVLAAIVSTIGGESEGGARQRRLI